MAFTTDFDGDELPAEWSFSSALGDGSVTVSDGWAHITCPSSPSHDSFSSPSNADNSVGVAAAIPEHDGNIDAAYRVGTDVSDRRGMGVSLLAYNADKTSAVRFSWFKATADGYFPSFYGYSRAGGSGATITNSQFSAYQSGIPAWLRISYVAATGVWTAYDSADGVTWRTAATVTRSMTVTTTKFGVTTTSGYPSVVVRLDGVIDVIAAGTTDLRAAVPDYVRVPVASIAGTEGSLPSGFADRSAGTSTLTLTGTALRLTHDVGQDNTPVSGGKYRAALGWDDPRYEMCGLVFKATRVGSGGSLCFLTPSLGYPDPSGQPWDQYIEAGGYGQEIYGDGNIRRPLRIDNAWDRNMVVSSYPTGLDETPYTWLADLASGNNPGSGPLWFRLERHARGYRVREWVDGSPEPTTWNLFDGQDRIEDSPLGPYISLSHNANPGGSTTCVFDLANLEFYRLVEPSGSALLASTALLGV